MGVVEDVMTQPALSPREWSCHLTIPCHICQCWLSNSHKWQRREVGKKVGVGLEAGELRWWK
jgi:hypothetical protein